MKSLSLIFCWTIQLSAQSNPFIDKSQSLNIPMQYGNHGVSVVDFDNDGWEDIFIANIPNFAGEDSSFCVLLKNNSGENFSNVASSAGLRIFGSYRCGVWGDVNNDGYSDLFLAETHGIGRCHLFMNNKNGTFQDIVVSCGINFSSSVATAAFGDYDNDGKLDLFVTTEYPEYDHLYRNISHDDVIAFQDVTSAARIGGFSSTTPMQGTFIDYDHDGYLDIYAVHDGYFPSTLFRNNGNGSFTDVSAKTKLDDYGAGNSMGVYWKDFDFDGWEEVYVTRIGQGGLYKRQKDSTYKNIADSVGAELNGMSWGIVWEDFDNDRDDDMFIVNTFGYNGVKSLYYENVNGSYIEKAQEYGIDYPLAFYGLAYGDFNNDGYLDLVASASDGNNKLLLNTKNRSGNWLKLSLTGTTVNTMAVGVKARVIAGNRSQTRAITAGNSFASQMSTTMHFGLGPFPNIDTLEIIWSNDNIQRFTNVSVNQQYYLIEGNVLTSVKNSFTANQIPIHSSLEQNYPNPFNPSTTIRYFVAERELVRITILDLLGREVQTIVNTIHEPGNYVMDYNASVLSSGTYFYRLESESHVETKKMMILK